MASRTPNVLLSSSNEFDNLARYMQHVEMKRQLQQLEQQQQQLMQFPGNVVQVQYSLRDEPPSVTDDFDELPEPGDDVL